MQISIVKKNFLVIEKLRTILFLGLLTTFTYFDNIWIFSAYCGKQISSTFQSTDLFSSPIAFGHSLIMTFAFHLSCPNVSCYDLQQSHSYDWSNTKWILSPMVRLISYDILIVAHLYLPSDPTYSMIKLSKENLNEKESAMYYFQMYLICMNARLLGNIEEWKIAKVLTRL